MSAGDTGPGDRLPAAPVPGAPVPGAPVPGAPVPGAPAGNPDSPGEPEATRQLEAALRSLDLDYESPRPGAYLVRLAGQHKLATMTWLIAETHSLHVEAFFCRRPDENEAEFYRFLLERGSRMYGVHFALDPVGDVYLVGRLPLSSISAAGIDRLLGCVLSYSDDNFDQALMLGFASAIRREWAWRTKRGESLANLRAFARLTGPDPGQGDGGGDGQADGRDRAPGGPDSGPGFRT